jgi:hypothetical protein
MRANGGTAPVRRSRGVRLKVLFAALGAALLALGIAITLPTSGGSRSSAQCANRVNDTPKRLIECVRRGDLWTYLRAFQAIADDHPGPDGHPSRNSGEPGYLASAHYVANLMTDWGYRVHIQTFRFFYFAFTRVPTFREVSPVGRDYALGSDWRAGQSSGSTTAAVQPAGGIVRPPSRTTSSTSGCDQSDFTRFVSGRVALIQRGGCAFGVKVLNAQAAGASGVVIFNEGGPERTGLVHGGLVDANGNRFVPRIPVAFTSYDIGSDLASRYDAAVRNHGVLPAVSLDIQSVHNADADGYNVIADSPTGDPRHVLVVDAHLDAIYGAGLLDNASGSVTILDIAHMIAKVHPRNRLRFIWFGAEELGLFGSQAYVGSLPPRRLSQIGYDLDADVTATPNYDIGILDPAAVDFFGRTVSTRFPAGVYAPSKTARDQAIDYFHSQGMNHMLFSPVGTDAFTFNEAGIPASGVLTGQDCCKTQREVGLFGGYPGNYEGRVPGTDGGCVDNPFRWCDNLGNNDPAVLTFMSRGFAQMVAHMAFADLATPQTTVQPPLAAPLKQVQGWVE